MKFVGIIGPYLLGALKGWSKTSPTSLEGHKGQYIYFFFFYVFVLENVILPKKKMGNNTSNARCDGHNEKI